MENNALQIEITEQDEKNGVLTSLNNKLDSLSVSVDNCCIYKVPEFIVKGHECFYHPRMMSVGPVFYKDPKLENMQETKLIYLKCFLQHPNNARPSLEHYINFVREKEVEIRGSYQQESSLSNDEFVEMIVLDAAFLIYYCMVYGATTLPYFDIPYIKNKLQALMYYSDDDLFLLENQIPYFVLKGIFNIAFGHIYEPITLINATLTFIGMMCSGIPGSEAIESIIDGNKITDESSIQHLLDVKWMCSCLSLSTPLRNQPTRNPTAESDSYIHKVVSLICPSTLCNRQRHQHHLNIDGHGYRHLCYTAKQLVDAGVTFMAGKSENPLDIKFANGKLTISKLRIEDSTEAYLRNLVYFEQCHYYQDSYFIDYILFLDDLIDSVEDVQVFVQNKILSNHLGSDDDVVKLFNNIGKNVVTTTKNYYFDVSDALNYYASTRRNRWMAILRSKYFNHPWTILSVIATFILFVLTLLQTIAAYIYK